MRSRDGTSWGNFHIVPDLTFDSLIDLMEYYKSHNLPGIEVSLLGLIDKLPQLDMREILGIFFCKLFDCECVLIVW